jgi:hypothetical protein
MVTQHKQDGLKRLYLDKAGGEFDERIVRKVRDFGFFTEYSSNSQKYRPTQSLADRGLSALCSPLFLFINYFCELHYFISQ